LNKKIDLEIERNGKPLRVSTELREQPPDYQTARAIPRPGQPNLGNPLQPQPNAPDNEPEQEEQNALGSVSVSELTPELTRQLDLPPGVRGVVVTAADSPELQRGDVIEEIDQQPVKSVAEFDQIVSGLDSDSAHVLSVCRRRVRSFVVLRPR
jgi:serine protease Do